MNWVKKVNGKKFSNGKRYAKVTSIREDGLCWFADGGMHDWMNRLVEVKNPIINDIEVDIEKMFKKSGATNWESYKKGIEDLVQLCGGG